MFPIMILVPKCIKSIALTWHAFNPTRIFAHEICFRGKKLFISPNRSRRRDGKLYSVEDNGGRRRVHFLKGLIGRFTLFKNFIEQTHSKCALPHPEGKDKQSEEIEIS